MHEVVSAVLRPRCVCALALVLVVSAGSSAQQIPVPNGGFEAGFTKPWGTGQNADHRAIWWNSGGCKSTAVADSARSHGGAFSLHITNRCPRATRYFGTTQQPVAVPPGRRIQVTVFASARNLRSDGAVSIVVDDDWKVRPIQLPKGSYGWTRFTGEFVPTQPFAQLRILSEDVGDAWIDDIRLDVIEDRFRLPDGLAALAESARPLSRPHVTPVGPEASTVRLEGGARIHIPAGSLAGPAKLRVTMVDLGLDRVALDVERAVAYEISADVDPGRLAAPIVLELPTPTAGASVVERVGDAWERRALPPGETTRVEIDRLSTRLFAHILWLDYDDPSNRVLSRMERSVAMANAGPGDDAGRAQHGPADPDQWGEWLRRFYGVGERGPASREETCERVREALARYAAAGRLAPPDDRPWTREQLFEHLMATGRPSDRRGYFYEKVEGIQPAITERVLDHAGSLSPADLLRVCVDLTGGDVPLGVLAAQVWTRDLDAAGRAFPAGAGRDVPREIGEPVSKLQPWRASDTTPSGGYDKIGPLCHLFSSMTAGIWGGAEFRRLVTAGDPILGPARLAADHADPEKGAADSCGLAVARWVNDGMPGSVALLSAVEPFIAPPPKTRVVGSGRWEIEGWEGGGRISLTIDAARGTVTGAIDGWHRGPGAQRIHLSGRIAGRYEGSPVDGRIEATITYGDDGMTPPKGEAVRGGSEALTANLVGGKVTGWAITGKAIKAFTFAVD